MALGIFQSWSVFRFGLMFLAGLYILGSIVAGITSSIFYLKNTGDYKPLLDSTFGVIFSADYKIGNSVDLLKNVPDIPLELNKFFIQEIIQSFVIAIAMIFIFYWLIKKLYQTAGGKSEEMLNPLDYLFVLIITLAFVSFSQTIYIGAMTREFTIPFSGIFKLITNLNVLQFSGETTLFSLQPYNISNLIENGGIT